MLFFTPQNSNTLELLLLDDLSPNNTELCNVNQIYESVMQKSIYLFTPIKVYDERLICIHEITNDNIIIIREKIKI